MAGIIVDLMKSSKLEDVCEVGIGCALCFGGKGAISRKVIPTCFSAE